jgi:glycosyltransferase involved in cell wall biosynthesis
MPELSLIIATLGRTLELDRLMATLVNQSFRNFEIIIVDQNADDRLTSFVQAAKNNGLILTHLRHQPPNLASCTKSRDCSCKRYMVRPFLMMTAGMETTTLERLIDRCRRNAYAAWCSGRWVEQDPVLTSRVIVLEKIKSLS